MCHYKLFQNVEGVLEAVDTREEVCLEKYLGKCSASWSDVVRFDFRDFDCMEEDSGVRLYTFEDGTVKALDADVGDYVAPEYTHMSIPLNSILSVDWFGNEINEGLEVEPIDGGVVLNPNLRGVGVTHLHDSDTVLQGTGDRGIVGWRMSKEEGPDGSLEITPTEEGLKVEGEEGVLRLTQILGGPEIASKTELRFEFEFEGEGAGTVELWVEGSMLVRQDSVWVWSGRAIRKQAELVVKIPGGHCVSKVALIEG